MRPNERFGGRGQRARVCCDCRRLPKATLQRNLATVEILGFIEQSNISPKNIARLHSLASIEDPTFQELRTLILEIAQLVPCKRQRWKLIASKNTGLLKRAISAGLAEDDCESYESDEPDHVDLAEIRDPNDFDDPETL